MSDLSSYPVKELEVLRATLISQMVIESTVTNIEKYKTLMKWCDRITEAMADRTFEDGLLSEDSTDWKRFTKQ